MSKAATGAVKVVKIALIAVSTIFLAKDATNNIKKIEEILKS